MFKIDKLKDTGQRPIKFNRFHRHVPLFVRKCAPMSVNKMVDGDGWWRLVFSEGGFVHIYQILAAVKGVQKIVRRRYNKGDYVLFGLNKMKSGLSKKSAGSRMGRGKGPSVYWGLNVQAGETLVRINCCVTKRVALEAFHCASERLPFKIEII